MFIAEHILSTQNGGGGRGGHHGLTKISKGEKLPPDKAMPFSGELVLCFGDALRTTHSGHSVVHQQNGHHPLLEKLFLNKRGHECQQMLRRVQRSRKPGDLRNVLAICVWIFHVYSIEHSEYIWDGARGS